MYHPIDDPQPSCENDQHHVIENKIVAQRQDTKQITAWHALQTILPAGKWRLQEIEIAHLRQRERNHGKIDALATDRQTTDNITDDCRAHGTEQDADLRGKTPDLDCVAGSICSAAKKERMPE